MRAPWARRSTPALDPVAVARETSTDALILSSTASLLASAQR